MSDTITSEKIGQLASALLEAQRKAQAVGKDSTNTHQRYQYASAEAIIGEARKALNVSGLVLITLAWRLVSVAANASKDYSATAYRIDVTYKLLHQTGEWHLFECSTPVVPGKGRPEDKAEFSALTANLAYFLRGLLLLPRLDEDAIDQRDDSGGNGAAETVRDQLVAEWVRRIQNASGEDFAAIPAQIQKLGLSQGERDRLLPIYTARATQLKGAQA